MLLEVPISTKASAFTSADQYRAAIRGGAIDPIAVDFSLMPHEAASRGKCFIRTLATGLVAFKALLATV